MANALEQLIEYESVPEGVLPVIVALAPPPSLPLPEGSAADEVSKMDEKQAAAVSWAQQETKAVPPREAHEEQKLPTQAVSYTRQNVGRY